MYARVATSQFLDTTLADAFPHRLRATASKLRIVPTLCNLSVGNRLYLKLMRVHTFPVVETRSIKPCRLLIVRSLRLLPECLHILNAKVLP